MNRRPAFLLLPGFLALLPLIACNPAGVPTREARPFAVIAYWSGGGKAAEGAPAGKLTHIIFSFLHLKGDTLAFDGKRDGAAIASLLSLKKRNPALKVMLSLGGWGGCAPCSGAFATERGRKEFAASALRVLRETGTDGIDIDWEYPAIEGYPGHRYGPDDRHNFTLLMKELRETLGERYEVSFAAGGFTGCLVASVEWDQVMRYADRVNLMTYDLVNANSTVTGHQTPLFSSAYQRESTDNAVRILDSLGVGAEKIVIGSAFYARVWEGVPDTNNGLFQPGRFVRYVPYRNLEGYLGEKGGFKRFWDTASQAAFSFSAEKGLFATYDDARSEGLKTNYALDKHLGGIMFWELPGDLPSGGLLDAIDGALKAATSRRP
jgi:chitinase